MSWRRAQQRETAMTTYDAIILECLKARALVVWPEWGIVLRRVRVSYGYIYKEVKGQLSPKGYKQIKLATSTAAGTVLMHRVIWIAAHGDIPDGMTIDHINSDKTDNRLCNLQLLTIEDNILKAWRDGRYKQAVKNRSLRIEEIVRSLQKIVCEILNCAPHDITSPGVIRLAACYALVSLGCGSHIGAKVLGVSKWCARDLFRSVRARLSEEGKEGARSRYFPTQNKPSSQTARCSREITNGFQMEDQR